MSQNRSSSSQFLSKILPRLVKPSFVKKGFVQAAILLEWPQIVGTEMAEKCVPEKLMFPQGKRGEGTLYLNVQISSGLLFEYGAALIIDKINSFFGYKAVSRLKIKQVLYNLTKASSLEKNTHTIVTLSEEELSYLESIEPKELREALMSYYKNYKQKTPKS